MAHVPVLLARVLEGLAIDEAGCYIDATFGRGGHSAEILARLGPKGRLIGIDRDVTAVRAAEARFAGDERFSIEHAAFAGIEDIARTHGVAGRVDGVLFDFGVSSPQLDDADRGFSFLRDGPLDMRMDIRQAMTAEHYIRDVSERALRRDLATLGEERLAGRIARAIVQARGRVPLRTTRQLADIVEASTPARVRATIRRHPATKTFQAIRMRVNAEVEQISDALDAVIDLLRVGGRACFVTFHSLEDRPVKRFLRAASAEDPRYRGLPLSQIPESARPRLRLIGKAQTADDQELAANPRARSARLRIAERLR